MDESALNDAMDRYACGDAHGFAILHRSLFPRLLAYLTRMSGSASIADDLVQETFLRMHRARATFAAGGAVLPWAYAIARNVHIDHARSRKLRDTERLPSDPGPEAIDQRSFDGESTAIAAEAARVVERVLGRLPPSQRDAFVLLRYEGLRVQDAAAILGATPTAVKLRAFRAYEALRAALEESRTQGGGPPNSKAAGDKAEKAGDKAEKAGDKAEKAGDKAEKKGRSAAGAQGGADG
jgi:RNA polymerase sigma-70 factor, ECF subfamily